MAVRKVVAAIIVVCPCGSLSLSLLSSVPAATLAAEERRRLSLWLPRKVVVIVVAVSVCPCGSLSLPLSLFVAVVTSHMGLGSSSRWPWSIDASESAAQWR